MTAFVDAFRAALVEQGHPADRIDWLVGLVTVEGLPEPEHPILHPKDAIGVSWRWDQAQWAKQYLTLEVRDAKIVVIWWTHRSRVNQWENYWTAGIRTIAELVWQDALTALGVVE